ncbi:MAG: PorT family protein [Prevotella sp.]|nr:PorT family protein [Prevotella sp.]
MKKLIIAMTLLSIFGMMPTWAQSGDGFILKTKSNVVKLGPKVGLGFTSMGQPKEVDLVDGAGAGYSFGLAMKARLGRATKETLQGGTGILGFGLEMLYKQNKVNTIGEQNLSLGYLEIPLTLQLYPMSKSNMMNSFYVEVGPDFAMIASKSPDVLTVPSANLAYHTGDFKGGDLRIIAGIGYTIPKTSLDINARYYIGTSELAGNFPCKTNTLEFSLAWMFNIAKF